MKCWRSYIGSKFPGHMQQSCKYDKMSMLPQFYMHQSSGSCLFIQAYCQVENKPSVLFYSRLNCHKEFAKLTKTNLNNKICMPNTISFRCLQYLLPEYCKCQPVGDCISRPINQSHQMENDMM